MSITSLANRGYVLNEYILVIQPHEDLCNTINGIKKTFAQTYQLPPLNYSKPNITLVHFKQYDMMERKIIHRLQNVATANAPFKIELHNFGSFPTHTIFINVTTKNSILEVISALKPMQALLKPDNTNKPHFITEPHVMIARKLLPWQFEKGWLAYSNTHFSGQFMANELVLLKKKEGSKVFLLAGKFPLLNQKTALAQATLF